VPFKQRTIPGLHKSAERAREYLRLRAASAKDDPKAKALFLRMQLQERQLDLSTALKKRSGLEARPSLLADLDLLILHLRIRTRIQTHLERSPLAERAKRRAELGPEFWKLWTDGPKPGPRVGRGYWFAILEWAESEKKVDVYAKALEALRVSLDVTDPDATWVPGLLRRYEARLTALRKR
jgi:hypothetical protein